jgi:hypothetical protein
LQILGAICNKEWGYQYALTAAFSSIVFGLNWVSPNFHIPGILGQFDILIRIIFTGYGLLLLDFLYKKGKLTLI